MRKRVTVPVFPRSMTEKRHFFEVALNVKMGASSPRCIYERRNPMFDFESEDVQLLADVGFLSISRGFDTHAEMIFKGLQGVRPAQEAGYLGEAMVLLFRKDYEKAITLLKKLPPTDGVSTFMGLALMQMGAREDAMEVFSDVIQTASGTPFAEIARQGIERFKS